MEKKEYKNRQRELLANTIQKIKNENGIDKNLNLYNNELNHIKIPKKSKEKKNKSNKRKYLKVNDNLSQEIQDFSPKKNTNNININYEKSKQTKYI